MFSLSLTALRYPIGIPVIMLLFDLHTDREGEFSSVRYFSLQKTYDSLARSLRIIALQFKAAIIFSM
jgi:hypothetical protein